MASGGRVRGLSSKWTCFFCFLKICGRSMLDIAKLCIGKHVDSQIEYEIEAVYVRKGRTSTRGAPNTRDSGPFRAGRSPVALSCTLFDAA